MATRVITSEQELKDLILLGVTGKYRPRYEGDDNSDWPIGPEIRWAKGGKVADAYMQRQISAGCYLLETE